MKPFATLAFAAALSAVTGTLGTALAQPASPQGAPWAGRGYMMGPGTWGPGGMMGNGYGYMGPGMMGWGDRSAMCTAMADHVAGRLAYTKAELKITEAQEALWKAYAEAAQQSAQVMATRCATIMGRSASNAAELPQRLDENEQLMAAQLEALRAVNKALKPLYTALNDAQKQAANQLFWGPMGMM